MHKEKSDVEKYEESMKVHTLAEIMDKAPKADTRIPELHDHASSFRKHEKETINDQPKDESELLNEFDQR